MQKFDQLSLLGIEAALRNYPIGAKVRFVRDSIKKRYIGDADEIMTVVSSLPLCFITSDKKLVFPVVEPKEYERVGKERDDDTVIAAMKTNELIPRSIHYPAVKEMAMTYPTDIFPETGEVLDTRLVIPRPTPDTAESTVALTSITSVGITPLDGVFVARDYTDPLHPMKNPRHFIFTKYSDWLLNISSTTFNMLKR